MAAILGTWLLHEVTADLDHLVSWLKENHNIKQEDDAQDDLPFERYGSTIKIRKNQAKQRWATIVSWPNPHKPECLLSDSTTCLTATFEKEALCQISVVQDGQILGTVLNLTSFDIVVDPIKNQTSSVRLQIKSCELGTPLDDSLSATQPLCNDTTIRRLIRRLKAAQDGTHLGSSPDLEEISSHEWTPSQRSSALDARRTAALAEQLRRPAKPNATFAHEIMLQQGINLQGPVRPAMSRALPQSPGTAHSPNPACNPTSLSVKQAGLLGLLQSRQSYVAPKATDLERMLGGAPQPSHFPQVPPQSTAADSSAVRLSSQGNHFITQVLNTAPEARAAESRHLEEQHDSTHSIASQQPAVDKSELQDLPGLMTQFQPSVTVPSASSQSSDILSQGPAVPNSAPSVVTDAVPDAEVVNPNKGMEKGTPGPPDEPEMKVAMTATGSLDNQCSRSPARAKAEMIPTEACLPLATGVVRTETRHRTPHPLYLKYSRRRLPASQRKLLERAESWKVDTANTACVPPGMFAHYSKEDEVVGAQISDRDPIDEEDSSDDDSSSEYSLPTRPQPSTAHTNGTRSPEPDSDVPFPDWPSSPPDLPTEPAVRGLPPSSSGNPFLPRVQAASNIETGEDIDNDEEKAKDQVVQGIIPTEHDADVLDVEKEVSRDPLGQSTSVPNRMSDSDATSNSSDSEENSLHGRDRVSEQNLANKAVHVPTTSSEHSSNKTTTLTSLRKSGQPRLSRYSGSPSKYGLFAAVPIAPSSSAVSAMKPVAPTAPSAYASTPLNQGCRLSVEVEVEETPRIMSINEQAFPNKANECTEKRPHSPGEDQDAKKRRKSSRPLWPSSDESAKDPNHPFKAHKLRKMQYIGTLAEQMGQGRKDIMQNEHHGNLQGPQEPQSPALRIGFIRDQDVISISSSTDTDDEPLGPVESMLEARKSFKSSQGAVDRQPQSQPHVRSPLHSPLRKQQRRCKPTEEIHDVSKKNLEAKASTTPSSSISMTTHRPLTGAQINHTSTCTTTSRNHHDTLEHKARTISQTPTLTALWQSFKDAYRYQGGLKGFKNLCQRLEQSEQSDTSIPPQDWDAYVLKYDRSYKPYLLECIEDAETPLDYNQYWWQEMGNEAGTLARPPILNATRIRLALSSSEAEEDISVRPLASESPVPMSSFVLPSEKNYPRVNKRSPSVQSKSPGSPAVTEHQHSTPKASKTGSAQTPAESLALMHPDRAVILSSAVDDQYRITGSRTDSLRGTPALGSSETGASEVQSRFAAVVNAAINSRELQYLLTLAEPQRTVEWLKRVYVFDDEAELSQTECYKLYKAAFANSKVAKVLVGKDFLNFIPSTFLGAQVGQADEESGKFVIRGIRMKRRQFAAEGRPLQETANIASPRPKTEITSKILAAQAREALPTPRQPVRTASTLIPPTRFGGKSWGPRFHNQRMAAPPSAPLEPRAMRGPTAPLQNRALTRPPRPLTNIDRGARGDPARTTDSSGAPSEPRLSGITRTKLGGPTQTIEPRGLPSEPRLSGSNRTELGARPSSSTNRRRTLPWDASPETVTNKSQTSRLPPKAHPLPSKSRVLKGPGKQEPKPMTNNRKIDILVSHNGLPSTDMPSLELSNAEPLHTATLYTGLTRTELPTPVSLKTEVEQKQGLSGRKQFQEAHAGVARFALTLQRLVSPPKPKPMTKERWDAFFTSYAALRHDNGAKGCGNAWAIDVPPATLPTLGQGVAHNGERMVRLENWTLGNARGQQ